MALAVPGGPDGHVAASYAASGALGTLTGVSRALCISVYAAQKDAVVMTHDVEFSARRRRNPHGRHVQLGCPEPDAIEIIAGCLDDLVAAIEPFGDIFVYVSKGGIATHLKWS